LWLPDSKSNSAKASKFSRLFSKGLLEEAPCAPDAALLPGKALPAPAVEEGGEVEELAEGAAETEGAAENEVELEAEETAPGAGMEALIAGAAAIAPIAPIPGIINLR
jgi:hypothetical protein